MASYSAEATVNSSGNRTSKHTVISASFDRMQLFSTASKGKFVFQCGGFYISHYTVDLGGFLDVAMYWLSANDVSRMLFLAPIFISPCSPYLLFRANVCQTISEAPPIPRNRQVYELTPRHVQNHDQNKGSKQPSGKMNRYWLSAL